MGTITAHHDGLGLNDLMTIYADDPDPNAGGASHVYHVKFQNEATQVAEVQFQHGPRLDPASKKGITEAVLAVILIDRLTQFQRGPMACPENNETLFHLHEALNFMRTRAQNRAVQGVLGTMSTHTPDGSSSAAEHRKQSHSE